MNITRLPLHSNGHLLTREDEVTVWNHPLIHEDEPYCPDLISRSCAYCDEYPQLRVSEEAVEVMNPCLYPDGITTEITLRVPSGKIIVTDDLRPFYNGFDHDHFASYNSALGQAQVVESMAKLGCAFGPVGNSCPGLYKERRRDHYIIASGMSSRRKELAGIITDLWAYSIADFEDWKSKGGDPDKMGWTESVVEIRPGTYRFTHHTGERGFNHDASKVIFAHIERIGDA